MGERACARRRAREPDTTLSPRLCASTTYLLTAPLRGSYSQAGGPLQRARPLAARAVGSSEKRSGR